MTKSVWLRAGALSALAGLLAATAVPVQAQDRRERDRGSWSQRDSSRGDGQRRESQRSESQRGENAQSGPQ